MWAVGGGVEIVEERSTTLLMVVKLNRNKARKQNRSLLAGS